LRVTPITGAQGHETSGDGFGRQRDAPEEEANMPDTVYPSNTREFAQKRRELSPDTEAAFQAFSQKVFGDGALPAKVKQIVAVAVAHVTQCPYCIKGHTKAALRHGASPEELMEAIWVATEMRAGGAYAHSVLAIEEMEKAAAAGA
jgi:AhpD family alkylhydroperoxidase